MRWIWLTVLLTAGFGAFAAQNPHAPEEDRAGGVTARTLEVSIGGGADAFRVWLAVQVPSRIWGAAADGIFFLPVALALCLFVPQRQRRVDAQRPDGGVRGS